MSQTYNSSLHTARKSMVYNPQLSWICLKVRICFPHLRLIRAPNSTSFSLQKHSLTYTLIPSFSLSPSLSKQWRELGVRRRFCRIILFSRWIRGHFSPTISCTTPTMLCLLRLFLCQISCICSRSCRAHVLRSRGLPPRRWSMHRRRLPTLASRRKSRGWRGSGRPYLAAGRWRRSWGRSSRIVG